MKILFASDVYFSRSNGTTISAQRFVTRLRERGHEVRVLTNHDERPLPEQDMYALKTQKVPGFNHLLATNGFAFAKTDRKIIREAIEWADVVHMMMNFPMEKACTELCIEMHKPMTTAFHVQMENITSQFNWGNVRWLNKALYRYFYRYFYSHHRFVHCPSQFMKDELIRYGYEGLDLRAISNGVSEKFVYRRPPEIGMFGTKFVVLMVGRLSHEKRQDLIIEAIRRSRYSHQIQLVFAGNGPLKKQLEKQGEKLPVKPVFGYYTQEQLIEIMAQTDLYIHASDMESEAIGCIEAFATGLVPIISNSRLSATRQFALTERSLFEAGNTEDLKNQVEWWFEHREQLPEWEIRYAESAKQYQLKDSVDKFEQMLQDAIAYYQTLYA